ncbi:MAG: aminotransferase class I/II-fold pyridoxal phosphate-dependent enzyme [Ignavibacteria bacterium]|nr:aminotransferase class I/II-fold pyridoxal phosphate-dependent enzyme [Ignavibacteria bacterium]
MNIQTAARLESVKEYYFSTKLREIEELNKQGKDIINLGIGSPDVPPHHSIISELAVQAEKPNTHAYQSYRGAAQLREAFAAWYKKFYNVQLSAADEILPLIGSKEGIMHICMTYLNPGDKVLVPNPGYPTYRSAVTLAGGECVEYNLTDSTNWFPDFAEIEAAGLEGVKLMWMNYPHMPTGTLPNDSVFSEAVTFARKHNILLCHDNPYSFILNESPVSILATPGAMECTLELNSLSKSHNMAGWRIGMLAGNRERINEVIRFKSNMDSGMFLPMQLAAAKALSLDADWYDTVNEEYRRRKLIARKILAARSCTPEEKQAGLFIWAKIPDNQIDCYTFTDEILQKARVFLTPGGIFGSNGQRYIRLSLCTPLPRLQEAAERIGYNL